MSVRRVLCRLGYHDYVYVCEMWRRPNPWTSEGWNHECRRCGKSFWFGGDRR